MKTLTLGLCVLACSALLADTVPDILARMDQDAPNFHSMTADLAMDEYTAILSDTTHQTGTLQMQRNKNGQVRAIVDLTATGGNDARKIGFLGNIVQIYYPKLGTYQEFEVGKNSDVLNQFLLLGFGSSGKDLAKGYEITAGSNEKVAGQDTTKLLLVPKDPKVRERLSKIEVWIPEHAAYPVQQQFYEPSGNYRKVTYSNIQLNSAMPGVLEMKLPPGTKKQSSS